MLIEVVGVDGSGKTTLIQGLRRLINESGRAYAYERSFQSDGLRLLEAAASVSKRTRPANVYDRRSVELVRAVELVGWSMGLQSFAGTAFQVVFCDSYVTEQAARMIALADLDPDNVNLLRLATKPDLILQLKIDPEVAVSRMKQRAKGDALLLNADPVAETRRLAEQLESAATAMIDARTYLDGGLSIEVLQNNCFTLVSELIGGAA